MGRLVYFFRPFYGVLGIKNETMGRVVNSNSSLCRVESYSSKQEPDH